MIKKLQIIIFPVLILASLSCRGTFAPPGAEEEKPDKTTKETTGRFEPLDMSEDYAIVSKAVSFEQATDSANNIDGQNQGSLADSAKIALNGDRVYRIQLFTAKEYGPAIREKNIAIEVFDKPVTMDYEVPYYKIRVGNFATHEEADAYLPAAREAGYKTAWVVRSYINVNNVEDIYDGYDEEIFNLSDSTEIPDTEYENEQNDIDYQED